MRYLIELLVLTLMTVLFSCNPSNEEICFKEFKFEVPFSVTPTLDTFSIGDTIWLDSEITHSLLDSSTNEIINVQDFNFFIKTAIGRLDTIGWSPSESSFEFINQIGEIQQTSFTNVDLLYEESESKKNLSVGLIPSEEGGFYITFGNSTEDLYNVSLIDTNCIQSIDMTYMMNNSGDENNIHFITEGIGIDKDTPVENLQKHGTYAFWVIE